MQAKIGSKIKELRQRDGRRQEDLAKALGVTPQAISRWEANGGYPDLGMIPSIANYFHVTIDELFGYDNDRERIIQEYQDKAQIMLNHDKDMTDCIALLRRGLEEFPAENVLKVSLAAALNKEGWNHKGDNSNRYWEEAAVLYEELLSYDQSCIIPLLSIYAELGEYEKAERKAMEQQPVDTSKEVLLGRIFGLKNGNQYRGEAVIALLLELRIAIDDAIYQNEDLEKSNESLEIVLALRKLYEKIFGQNCFGHHSDFCFIDMALVKLYCNIGDYDNALLYFDSAFEHYIKHGKWYETLVRHTEELVGCSEKKPIPSNEHFDTHILKEVNPNGGKHYLCEVDFLKYASAKFPDGIRNQLMNNPKYIEIF